MRNVNGMIPDRIKDLQEILKEEKLDALLVTHQSDLNFLTDFPLEGYALLISRKKAWAFMPMLLKDQFEENVTGCEIVAGVNLVEQVKKRMGTDGLKKTAFDPENENYSLGRALEKLGAAPRAGLTSRLRTIKKGEELRRIKKACSITAEAFRKLAPKVRPGRTERSVALELEDLMRRQGAESVAFELIVGSGPNSALPHHRSSEKVIRKNEAVVLDFGCTYELYRSDMTRTLFTGRPTEMFKKIHSIVEDSQKEGIRRVRPGIPSGEIDRASREIIEKAGYGPYFIHSTGHGVGLDIHEYPRVGPGSKEELKAGMIVTVEPGIYLKGKFGVRIEDTLLVTQKGSEVLTK